jgi:hypothetical protein
MSWRRLTVALPHWKQHAVATVTAEMQMFMLMFTVPQTSSQWMTCFLRCAFVEGLVDQLWVGAQVCFYSCCCYSEGVSNLSSRCVHAAKSRMKCVLHDGNIASEKTALTRFITASSQRCFSLLINYVKQRLPASLGRFQVQTPKPSNVHVQFHLMNGMIDLSDGCLNPLGTALRLKQA